MKEKNGMCLPRIWLQMEKKKKGRNVSYLYFQNETLESSAEKKNKPYDLKIIWGNFWIKSKMKKSKKFQLGFVFILELLCFCFWFFSET